jgi:hypothetical protein
MKSNRKLSLWTVTALVLVVSMLVPWTALAGDLVSDAVLSSDVDAPTAVQVGENTFDIKVWAEGNIADGKTGKATVVNKYNMSSTGTITADAMSTTELTFTVNYNYTQTCSTSPVKGCVGDPFIVKAKLIVATGTPAEQTGTLTVDMDGSQGLGVKVEDTGYVEVESSDNTPPVINYDLSGTLGANGWYTSDVGVDWTVTDLESAVTIIDGCVDQTINYETTGVTLSCTAQSAGGTAGPISVTVKIDKTGPTAGLAVTAGTPGSNGWYTSDVTVSTSGSDTISSPVTCTADQYQTTETTDTVFNGSCTNDAGLSTNATPLTIKLDKFVPTFGACPAGRPFYLNSGQQTVGPISAYDTVSLLDATASTLSGSVDTSSIGTKTVTFTAYDYAGNSATEACSYSVIYHWTGFFQPVDNDKLNTVKAGSAIPVKFSLSGNQGLNIFATGYPKSISINCSTGEQEDAIELTVNAGGSSLNYDPTADQYIYVWKTEKSWAGTCRRLEVKLIDDTTHTADFKFK